MRAYFNVDERILIDRAMRNLLVPVNGDTK